MWNEKICITFVRMKEYTVQKIIGRIIPIALFVILIPISLIVSLGIRLQSLIRKAFRQ